MKKGRLDKIASDIRARGWRYWVFAIAAIAGGMLLSYEIEHRYQFLGLRYSAYQLLQHTDRREMRYAQRVVFVAIGDDEFWTGELDQRIPIKRDYLARLVSVLDAANPAVLALDYNFRSPVLDGRLVETPAYAGETAKLIDAVEATRNAWVVLPLTFDQRSYDTRHGTFALDSSIFSNHRFSNPNVYWGYLNLHLDIRQIPLAIRAQGSGSRVRSFAQQIAALLDRRGTATRISDAELFGSFMPQDAFDTVAAGLVLAEPTGAWREIVKHQAVIVSSFAHAEAFRRGPFLDTWLTPVGEVPGVVAHANYVEALVRDKLYPVSPVLFSESAEVLLSLAVAVLFASRAGKLEKVAYFLIFLGSAVALSYLLLRHLAIFFDPVLPVLAVAAHSLFERAFGPRHEQ